MSLRTTTYLKKGKQKTKQVFKNNTSLYLKYLIYVLTSFLGKLLIIPYPLFALADIRNAKTAVENKTIEIEKSFADSNSPKKVWTSLIFIFLKLILFIAVIVVLSIFSALLAYLGYTIDKMLTFSFYVIVFVFGAIGVILMLSIIIMLCLYLAPAPYIIQSEDVGISEVLDISFRIMKKHGKKQLFNIYLIHLLYFLVLVILFSAIEIFLIGNMNSLVFTFCSIIFLLILLFLTPRIVFSCKVASYSLIMELIEEEIQDSLNNHDINNQKSRIKNEDILVKLFEDHEKEEEEQ